MNQHMDPQVFLAAAAEAASETPKAQSSTKAAERARRNRAKSKEEQQILARTNQDLYFKLNGYMFIPPPHDESMVESLKEVVNQSLGGRELTITGDYRQIYLGNIHSLSQTSMMLEVLEESKRIFTMILKKEVQVEIYKAALLSSPPYDNSGIPQEMHADNVGFVSLVCIIMLSEGGGISTHIVPRECHGAEMDVPRDRFLDFTFDTSKDFPDVKIAANYWYGPLLHLEPPRLFSKCQPKVMKYGEMEIFRSDILHAGPVANVPREVLFVEIRVKDEVGPNDFDYQFRIAELREVTGVSVKRRRGK